MKSMMKTKYLLIPQRQSFRVSKVCVWQIMNRLDVITKCYNTHQPSCKDFFARLLVLQVCQSKMWNGIFNSSLLFVYFFEWIKRKILVWLESNLCSQLLHSVPALPHFQSLFGCPYFLKKSSGEKAKNNWRGKQIWHRPEYKMKLPCEVCGCTKDKTQLPHSCRSLNMWNKISKSRMYTYVVLILNSFIHSVNFPPIPGANRLPYILSLHQSKQ